MKKEQRDLFGNVVTDPKRSMSDYFGVAPFSILNSVDGEWQKRKQRWNVLINDKGDARLGVLKAKNNKTNSQVDLAIQNLNNGVSILDSVLAELMIKWFTEKGFKTFDPFAGDTVFGFVSAFMNRPFEGIELRKEQAKFNQLQCDINNLNAKYICDSSENMDKYIKNESKDFSFRDFLTEYKNNNYTNSDNITRVRRKLQEKEINLRGKTYNKRQNICSDLKNKIHKL